MDQQDSIIYFVKNTQGYVKIGCTVNLDQRLATLSKIFGPLNVVHTVPGSFDLEKRYHWAFVDKRIYGEWFDLARIDIESIKEGWQPPEIEQDKFLPRIDCPEDFQKPRTKSMHILLVGTEVDDYELVKAYTGITNDNDLVRHLFREKAIQIRVDFPLLTCNAQAPAQAQNGG